MRTFYTGVDIEDLAASGIRQLEIGPDVILTDAARERTEELGIVLLTAEVAQASKAASAPAAIKNEPLPSRPHGCQHGALPVNLNRSLPSASDGPVLDQLVEAVNALKKRGG